MFHGSVIGSAIGGSQELVLLEEVIKIFVGEDYTLAKEFEALKVSENKDIDIEK